MECGLLYVRLTPIATKFCVAEEFRDVPIGDMVTLERGRQRPPGSHVIAEQTAGHSSASSPG
jgi:hypothetical protein